MSSERFTFYKAAFTKLKPKIEGFITGHHFLNDNNDFKLKYPFSDDEYNFFADEDEIYLHGSGIKLLKKNENIDEDGKIYNQNSKIFNGKSILDDEANNFIIDYLEEENRIFEFNDTHDLEIFIHKISKEKLIIKSVPFLFSKVKNFEKEDFLEEYSKLKVIKNQKENNKSNYPDLPFLLKSIINNNFIMIKIKK